MLLPFAFPSKTPASSFYPYPIDNSLRFDGSNSYMYYVPSTSTSRTQWTFSAWVKRAKLGTGQAVVHALDFVNLVNDQTRLFFLTDDTIQLLRYNTGTFWENRSTTRVFRDTSAWYHIVWALDAQNTTQALRSRLYVNGEEIPYSDFSVPHAPSATGSSFFCTAGVQTNIGASFDNQGNYHLPLFFDGYIANTHLIDGQVLDPTQFGELKSGIWVPKEYTGSYGTNGFHLDFADGTSAITLGYDAAGSNNFTPSGIATSDQMLDSPTNNFCTINPLKIGSVTLSEGNLQHQHSGSTSWRGVTPTMHVSSGKWYWEVAFTNLSTPPASTTRALVGIVSENETQTDVTAATYFTGITAEAYGYYNEYGSIWNNLSGTAYGSAWGNATIGIALDLDSSPKTLEFFLNGVSQGVLQDGTDINLGNKAWGPGASTYDSSIASYNFGQSDFTYTPPSDFLALSSVNLPAPTFDPAVGASPQDAFNVYTDTGANILATAQSDFTDGLFWIKDRQNANDHQLVDSVRGLTKELSTNSTAIEGTYAAPAGASVAWAWNAPDLYSGSTQGALPYKTYTARVNAAAGVSIVTYGGNGQSNHQIPHHLGVEPEFVICKNRDYSNPQDWAVYHKYVPYAYPHQRHLYLNNTSSLSTDVSGIRWYNTPPSSSVLTVGTVYETNAPSSTITEDQVAYLFASKEGFSKFGSYVGNANADGAFVYLGFRPAFVMVKCVDTSTAYTSWTIFDAARPGFNDGNAEDALYANKTSGEGFRGNGSAGSPTYPAVDLLSNGIKFRSDGNEHNAAYTYVYAAFAEQPFKFANAR